MTKSAVYSGFGQITEEILNEKLHFLCSEMGIRRECSTTIIIVLLSTLLLFRFALKLPQIKKVI